MAVLTKQEKKYLEMYQIWSENMGRLLLEIKNINDSIDLSSEEKLKMYLPLIKDTDLAFKAVNNLEETYTNSETLKKMKYEGKYGLPTTFKSLVSK